jgi:hypothetical protein
MKSASWKRRSKTPGRDATMERLAPVIAIGRESHVSRPEGVVRRFVDMVGGRHRLIERANDFTLVPWRPTLERQIGKPASGTLREKGSARRSLADAKCRIC